MDVGYLLQFERPLEGDGIVCPATEKQGMLFVGELFGDGFDEPVRGRLSVLPGPAIRAAQLTSRASVSVVQPESAAQGDREKTQGNQLGGERLGGSDADFGSRMGHQDQVRFPAPASFPARYRSRQAGVIAELPWHRPSADRVSMVSPDWESVTTRQCSGTAWGAGAELAGDFHLAGHDRVPRTSSGQPVPA